MGKVPLEVHRVVKEARHVNVLVVRYAVEEEVPPRFSPTRDVKGTRMGVKLRALLRRRTRRVRDRKSVV